jgi:uncharacterized membrane protein
VRKLPVYFLRGLVLVAPIALTIYVCYRVFVTIDRWAGLPVPGAGFLVTLVLITVVGFLASNFLARSLLGLVERVMNRLPFVRLLYTSTRDLLNAFVGEQRRFDKPVYVRLSPDAQAHALGFVTQDSLAQLGLADHVAVYLPQSYNFAGMLLVVPRAQVRPVPADSADVLAFIVSGGVTAVRGRSLPTAPTAGTTGSPSRP